MTRPATELEEGEETRTCRKDSTHTETRPVPVLTEHQFPLKKAEAKEASCTEEGNKEHWICEGCGKLFADEKAQKELSGKLFADEKAQKELSPEDVTIPPDRP